MLCPACNGTGTGPIDNTCGICDGSGRFDAAQLAAIGLDAIVNQTAMIVDDKPLWWCGCGDGVELGDPGGASTACA